MHMHTHTHAQAHTHTHTHSHTHTQLTQAVEEAVVNEAKEMLEQAKGADAHKRCVCVCVRERERESGGSALFGGGATGGIELVEGASVWVGLGVVGRLHVPSSTLA